MLFSHHTTKMALAHRAQPPESLGVKGVKHSEDGGVKDSNVSADSMLTSFLYHLIRHLSLTLSIPSLFDQGNGLNYIPNKGATMTVRALSIACR